jgi:DNA topoisomerase-1
MPPAQPPPQPPAASPLAAGAGLRWVNDAEPGIRRWPGGRGFRYLDAEGRPIRDAAALQRIPALVIPPAWQEVWICAAADGHLQATGRDARGRKQYRYHADWQAHRGQTKFEQLRRFGQVLPRIRRRVQRALAGSGRGAAQPTREHVLATLVRLLDTTWLRIGNAEYARANHSFGLSTLRTRHAALHGDELRLSFVGKGGVRHELRSSDRRVARVVRRCRELPGQELFQYVDADGGVHRVGSGDVNAWLAEAAGTRVTAKDFRTWHGSVQALELTLAACAEGAAPCSAPQVLAQVARRLGNTPAVCRKAYVHPQVLALGAALADDAARRRLREQRWALEPTPRSGLSLGERRLLALLGSAARIGRRGHASARSARRAATSKAAAR